MACLKIIRCRAAVFAGATVERHRADAAIGTGRCAVTIHVGAIFDDALACATDAIGASNAQRLIVDADRVLTVRAGAAQAGIVGADVVDTSLASGALRVRAAAVLGNAGIAGAALRGIAFTAKRASGTGTAFGIAAPA